MAGRNSWPANVRQNISIPIVDAVPAGWVTANGTIAIKSEGGAKELSPYSEWATVTVNGIVVAYGPTSISAGDLWPIGSGSVAKRLDAVGSHTTVSTTYASDGIAHDVSLVSLPGKFVQGFEAVTDITFYYCDD